MRKQSPAFPQYPSQTDKSSVSAQFGLTNTNIHSHTGAAMDGGQIDYNDLLNKPSAVSVYAGIIDAGGATGTLPAGWSVANTGTGDYTVTHNLDTTSYVVLAMAYGSGNTVTIFRQNINTFELLIVNNLGGGVDIAVNFTLVPL